METRFEVNIDDEKIRYEGEWIDRKELADKIKRMIDSQDFRIGQAGAALEHLQNAVANARTFEVKLAAADADLLDNHAARAGIPPPAFVRQAIQAYLAAQPPLQETTEKLTAITTEPAKPGEEADAVELTKQKPQTSSKVLVDPTLHSGEISSGGLDGSWPKKND